MCVRVSLCDCCVGDCCVRLLCVRVSLCDCCVGEIAATVLKEKLLDAQTPGFEVEFDPDEAEQAGAFQEDALSEADALDSTIDLTDLG